MTLITDFNKTFLDKKIIETINAKNRILTAAKQKEFIVVSEEVQKSSIIGVKPFLAVEFTHFKFNGGKWDETPFRVTMEKQDIDTLAVLFFNLGYTVTFHTMPTKEKIINCIENNIEVEAIEFFLNKVDEVLEVEVRPKESNQKEGFVFNIPVIGLDLLLEEIGIISIDNDNTIWDNGNEFDNVYELWECIEVSNDLATTIAYEWLRNEKNFI